QPLSILLTHCFQYHCFDRSDGIASSHQRFAPSVSDDTTQNTAMMRVRFTHEQTIALKVAEYALHGLRCNERGAGQISVRQTRFSFKSSQYRALRRSQSERTQRLIKTSSQCVLRKLECSAKA